MFLPLIKPILRIVLSILSVILYLFTILSAFGGRFDTAIFTFPAVLTLVLPVFATATLVVTILWFVFRRIIMGALGVLTLLACWSPITTVSPLSTSKKADPDSKTFTVMTWNIHHGEDQELKDYTGPNRTIHYIIHSGADIVCLQELKRINHNEIPGYSLAMRDSLRKIYPYWAGNDRLDMKVLSKYPVVYNNNYNYIDGTTKGPTLYSFFKVMIGDRAVNLVNLHLSSFDLSGSERQVVSRMSSVNGAKWSMEKMKSNVWKKLRSGFSRRKKVAAALRKDINTVSGPMIITGDFNDVPESYAYRLLRGTDLKDAYVETGFGPMVTFNQNMFWFHLDQVLYRGPLKALNVHRGSIKSSDHYPVFAKFELLPKEED